MPPKSKATSTAKSSKKIATTISSLTDLVQQLDDEMSLSPEIAEVISEATGMDIVKETKKVVAKAAAKVKDIKIPKAGADHITVAALKSEIQSVSLKEGLDIQAARRVWPTGSVGLDIAFGKIDPITGNGGIPELSILEFYGSTGVRKSNTVEKIAYNILMADPENIVVMLYTEDPDLERLRRMGMPMDRFQILGLYNPATPDVKLQLAEKRLMDLVEAAKYKNVKMIGIDSLKALVSITQMYKKGGEAKETIKPIEDDEVAIRAKLMEKMFNRILFQRRSAILVMTNQLSDRIPNRNDRFVIGAQSYDKTPAGRMKEFLSVIRVKIEAKPLYDEAKIKTGGDKDTEFNPQEGLLQFYKIKKNRWGRPNIKVVVPFDFATGDYDRSLEVLTLGVHLDIIKKSGSHYTFKEGKPQGKNEALTYLDEHVPEREEIYLELVKRGHEVYQTNKVGRANVITKAADGTVDEETGEVLEYEAV